MMSGYFKGFIEDFNLLAKSYHFSSLVNNISLIYNYQSGTVVTNSEKCLIPYARIWKCGNEAIYYNIGLLFNALLLSLLLQFMIICKYDL